MKPWASKIQLHIEHWSKQLPANRQNIPRYVYHFTAIPNAVNILVHGKLCSRILATKLRLMTTDNACAEIIEQTKVDHTRYARLYFRPRTPTQYNNEGIRPLSQRSRNSHCPTPVFFCFDAFRVLGMDEVEFSDGNMGTNRARHSGDENFFDSIPFEHVFHDGHWTNDSANTIRFHRHAEVLVPNELPLIPSLRHILLRSEAERSTLLGLLPPTIQGQWKSIMKVGGPNYFNRIATFVESVFAQHDNIKFEFNPDAKQELRGPFQVQFLYRERGRTWRYEAQMKELPTAWRLGVEGATTGVAELKLDGCLAFRGEVDFRDIPF